MTIQQQYLSTLKRYCTELSYIENCWSEIEAHYNEPHRYYHTLTHVEAMLSLLKCANTDNTHLDTLFFAAVYHDVIYNPQSRDNEKASAEMARKHLQQIIFQEIKTVEKLILATESHHTSADSLIALFLDCDLAILSGTEDAYKAYTKQIRQEYSHLEDREFYARRLAVLQQFLKKDSMYQTGYFKELFERSARKNISSEIEKIEALLTYR